MCDSLGIEPKPNNGTLRLPLKPIGLHSDKHTSTEDDHPPDLAAETSKIDISLASASITTPVDPLETNVPLDAAPVEGIP